MIGLDSNIVVRLLVQDAAAQLSRIQRAMAGACSEADPALVNNIVLVETVWVLASAYGYTRREIAHAIEALFQVKEIVLQNPDEAWEALTGYRRGNADFADYFLAAINRRLGCNETLTLDRKAARTATFRAV
jgi:predicted nucleic-acid-binding protein